MSLQFAALTLVQLCVAVVCAAETKAAILISHQCGHVGLSTFNKMAKTASVSLELAALCPHLVPPPSPPSLTLCLGVMLTPIMAISHSRSNHLSSINHLIS